MIASSKWIIALNWLIWANTRVLLPVPFLEDALSDQSCFGDSLKIRDLLRFLLFESFTDELFLGGDKFFKFVSDALVLDKEGSVGMELL